MRPFRGGPLATRRTWGYSGGFNTQKDSLMSQFIVTASLVVTIPAAASPCLEYAATELVRLLQKGGVSASIKRTAGSRSGQWLRLTPAAGAAAPEVPGVSRVRADGYAQRIVPGGVALAARLPKGILNAVYDLAEQLGYLFLTPGDAGEWAPEDGLKGVKLTAGEQLRNPRFPYRGVFGGTTTWPYSVEEWMRFHAKLRFNAISNLPLEQLPLAQQLGLRSEIGAHGMSELLPRELFATRPELFRMFQPEDFSGKRMSDSNFCVTNPETKRIVQENYRKKLHAAKGVYAIHAWADDLPAGGWCMCSRCRAYTPTDQAMLSMRLLTEVVAREKLPMRVPIIAYHDTMFPGKCIPAPKEGFLLFAPRERCYGHALNDPSCERNRWYFAGLKAWMEAFRGIGDAHTFEYYFDQILFRGLYPYLPGVILGDMAAYEKAGIESHMSLQVGGPIIAPEYNMLLFARAHWDKDLTPARFNRWLAAQIAPTNPEPWRAYLEERSRAFERAMCLCEYPTDIYFDYRFLPESTLPFSGRVIKSYVTEADRLDAAAKSLASATAKGPRQNRVRLLGGKEAGRARFEAADLRVMAHQQGGANGIAQYLACDSRKSLDRGLAELRQAIAALDVSYQRALDAGLPEKGAYYFAMNRAWLKKEFEAKIANYSG